MGARLRCGTGYSTAESVHVSNVLVKRFQIQMSALNWGCGSHPHASVSLTQNQSQKLNPFAISASPYIW